MMPKTRSNREEPNIATAGSEHIVDAAEFDAINVGRLTENGDTYPR